MGLSQFRGGGESESDEEMRGGGDMTRMVGAGRKKKGSRMSEATAMGLHLGKHLHSLHGAGFWDDFKQGFNSVIQPVANVAKPFLPLLGPEGAAASAALSAVGYGRHRGGGFFDDFKQGFDSVIKPVANIAKPFLPLLGPEGAAASAALNAVGYGRKKCGRGKLTITHGGAMYPSGAYEGQGTGGAKMDTSRMDKLAKVASKARLHGNIKSLHQRLRVQEDSKTPLKYPPQFAKKKGIAVPPRLVAPPQYAEDDEESGGGRESEDAMMTGIHGRGMLGQDGHGVRQGGRKKRAPAGPNDGRRKRAEIVRKVMGDKGLSMIEASKYVKAHNLY
jgi:hypothetical protein